MNCHHKHYSPYQRQVISKLVGLLSGMDMKFQYSKCANNHLKITIDGVDRVFHTGSTPSDIRSMNNFMGDIRAELKRMNTKTAAPQDEPLSQQRVKQRKSAEDFVSWQKKEQLKHLKKSLRKIRKQEMTMLTELQVTEMAPLASNVLAERVRQYRADQVCGPLEQAIKQHKGDLFIPPGLVKTAKAELNDFLDSHLTNLADYQQRLQKKLDRQIVSVAATPTNESVHAEPLNQESATSQESIVADESPATYTVSTTNTDSTQRPSQASPVVEQEAHMTLQAFVHGKPHQRIKSIKTLTKQQITQLIEDGQKALAQKHQEDISYLLQEMQQRGVAIAELQAAMNSQS